MRPASSPAALPASRTDRARLLLALARESPLLLPVLDREDGRTVLARDLRDGLAALLDRTLHGGFHIRTVACAARARRRTTAPLARCARAVRSGRGAEPRTQPIRAE